MSLKRKENVQNDFLNHSLIEFWKNENFLRGILKNLEMMIIKETFRFRSKCPPPNYTADIFADMPEPWNDLLQDLKKRFESMPADKTQCIRDFLMKEHIKEIEACVGRPLPLLKPELFKIDEMKDEVKAAL